MRFDLYQAETALIAQHQTAILDDARTMLLAGGKLSSLEKNGMLHTFQVLAENAITLPYSLTIGTRPIFSISAISFSEAKRPRPHKAPLG